MPFTLKNQLRGFALNPWALSTLLCKVRIEIAVKQCQKHFPCVRNMETLFDLY